MENIKTTVEKITPDRASQLLCMNNRNRPVRQSTIEAYSNAMKRGEWVVNGDAIRISETGIILDGQHRLYAICQSGMSIKSLVVYGLPDSVFTTIDRGIKRTTGDTLALMGEKNYNTLSSAAKYAFIYQKTGDPFCQTIGNPTTIQLVEFIELNPSLKDAVKFVCNFKWCRKLIATGMLSFCYFEFFKRNQTACNEFFSLLESGQDLHFGSSILLLRNRLIEISASKVRLTKENKCALIFKSFKLFSEGTYIKNLRVRAKGNAAENPFIL